jgi:CubicO group peptidase (beta-lactamase class C family)
VFVVVTAQTKSIKSSPPLTEASAARVGMSRERLSLIDAVCQDAIDNSEVSGIVALVARRGKIVYHKTFGTADATPKTQFKSIF